MEMLEAAVAELDIKKDTVVAKVKDAVEQIELKRTVDAETQAQKDKN